jgi:hypothetical protein
LLQIELASDGGGTDSRETLGDEAGSGEIISTSVSAGDTVGLALNMLSRLKADGFTVVSPAVSESFSTGDAGDPADRRDRRRRMREAAEELSASNTLASIEADDRDREGRRSGTYESPASEESDDSVDEGDTIREETLREHLELDDDRIDEQLQH